MNKSYRSIWNEALGAWVAASEITTARGKRSTRAVAIHAMAGAMALFATAAAHADVTAGTSGTLNPGSAFCSAIGTPAAGAPAWTCQVPNGVGGFATISGVATRASGGGPDLTALNALVTANLGVNAVLIGTTTTRAPGDNAVAVGMGASASGGASVAVGQSASATQLGATAVGASAQATAEHTVALGDLSRATGASAMAVGAGSNASGGGSFSAGLNSSASGFNGTAMGTLASASGFQSTAVGAGSTATGDYSSSYGINAHAGGQAATAIAFGASAAGDNDIAIGNGANTSGNGNNIAIGTLATASNTTGGAFAFGNHATATGQDAFAVGTQATASRQSSYAIGSLAQATGLESYALGYEAIAAGDYVTCQYMVRFDEAQLATGAWWKPSTCASLVNPPAVAAVQAPPPPVPVPMQKVTLGADGLFRFDGGRLEDLLPEGKVKIEKLGRDIRANFRVLTAVRVVGHTDRLGSEAYNAALSQRRADTVRELLVRQGLDGAKVTAVGRGEKEPVTRDCRGVKANPALIQCLQPDRRVEVEVLGEQ